MHLPLPARSAGRDAGVETGLWLTGLLLPQDRHLLLFLLSPALWPRAPPPPTGPPGCLTLTLLASMTPERPPPPPPPSRCPRCPRPPLLRPPTSPTRPLRPLAPPPSPPAPPPSPPWPGAWLRGRRGLRPAAGRRCVEPATASSGEPPARRRPRSRDRNGPAVT